MSQTETQLANGYGRLDDTDLTIHNPDKGTVIDVWERNSGILLDQYPVMLQVAKEQETLYKGVFANKDKAEQKAMELTFKF